MVKCPKCEEGELLMFLDENASDHYEIVYVCSKCGSEITRSDLLAKSSEHHRKLELR
jgi:Zn ribbon nucleic-acid-binding protein